MLTEDEKDQLREERAWARENILYLNAKLNLIIDEKNHYESGLYYWRKRLSRADRKLAFDEKLHKVASERDMSPLARILRNKDKAKELMELLRLAKKEVEEDENKRVEK